MFHHWISTGDDTVGPGHDCQCIRCGTVSPDFGSGVIADFGVLPIGCPGPGKDDAPAHHFLTAPFDGLQCAFCPVSITPETLPADVEWTCQAT